jgi:hypothetical protein
VQSFTNGTALQLFSAQNYLGTAPTIFPVVPAPGLVWDASRMAAGGNGSLRVTNVSMTPPALTRVVSGNNLTISWPQDHGGWRLLAQTNVLGVGLSNNWATVPNSANVLSVTVPIVTGNPTVFYRLVYP